MCQVSWNTKEPYTIPIRIKDTSKQKRSKIMKLPIILPHEMLDYLHRTKNIAVAPAEIKDYWEHYKRFKGDHPCCSEMKHSPLGIGGDDCKYTLAGAKVIIIGFNIILHDRGLKLENNSSIPRH